MRKIFAAGLLAALVLCGEGCATWNWSNWPWSKKAVDAEEEEPPPASDSSANVLEARDLAAAQSTTTDPTQEAQDYIEGYQLALQGASTPPEEKRAPVVEPSPPPVSSYESGFDSGRQLRQQIYEEAFLAGQEDGFQQGYQLGLIDGRNEEMMSTTGQEYLQALRSIEPLTYPTIVKVGASKLRNFRVYTSKTINLIPTIETIEVKSADAAIKKRSSIYVIRKGTRGKIADQSLDELRVDFQESGTSTIGRGLPFKISSTGRYYLSVQKGKTITMDGIPYEVSYEGDEPPYLLIIQLEEESVATAGGVVIPGIAPENPSAWPPY